MGEMTKIQWSDHTFNPVWGCAKVSPGCKHCYAEATDARYNSKDPHWGPNANRKTFGEGHWKQPLVWNRKAAKEGVRRRVFCGSMCDIFEDHTTTRMSLVYVWDLIKVTPWLDWLLLTKRPKQMVDCIESLEGTTALEKLHEVMPNVWLGTSIENQDYVDRLDHLTDVRPQVRFVSAEPLIGHLTLDLDLIDDSTNNRIVDWVIAGGESGATARISELQWFRDLAEETMSHGAAFFMKQMGKTCWDENVMHLNTDAKGGCIDDFPQELRIRQFPNVFNPRSIERLTNTEVS